MALLPDKMVTQEHDFSRQSVAYDIQAFEDLIQAHGLDFVHFVALQDPIGLISKTDLRRPDVVQDDHVSNGFYYVEAGKIRAILSGNTKEVRASSGGITNPGIAQLTSCLTYTGSEQRIYLDSYDRLYLDDPNVLTTKTDLVNASESGLDRLPFPAVEVLHVVDSRGVRYTSSDFNIVNGKIQWGAKRPSAVYSVKYTYRPFWLVHRMVHDLRVMQSLNFQGEREVKQAHQSCIVNREYMMLDSVQNDQGTNPRGVETPEEAASVK